MKKILAFICALTVCTTAFSCQSKNNKKSSDPITAEKIPDADGLTAVKLSDIAYKKSTLEIPSDIHMIYCTKVFNGGNNYLLVGAGTKSPQFWTTDRDFTELKEVEFPEFDIGINYDITVLDDGTVVTFVNSVDYGDLPAPDPSSPDYDADAYDAAAEYTFRIYTYSPDGSLLTNNVVTGFHTAAESGIMTNGIASDGKIVVANVNGADEVFTIDGVYIGELTVENGESVENLGTNRDGDLICAVRTEGDSVQFRKVTEDGTTEQTSLTYNFPETVYYDIVPGSGDYSMYVNSMSTIYGIKAEDNSIESLFSLNAAGLNSSNFSNFAIGSDGEFIVPISSYSDWSVSVKKFTQCDPAELENIPTITIGMLNEDMFFGDIVEDFNENNSDFNIKVKYYMENVAMPQHIDSNDEEAYKAVTEKLDKAYDNACEQIRQDALDGNLPDVLMISDSSDLNGRFGNIDLAELGALCDLYDFMDKDDTLTRNSFVPNVLNMVDDSYDGHAYALPTGFDVSLPNVAKTKFVGDVKKWDFDTYMDFIENESDILGKGETDIRPTQYGRTAVANYHHWIDTEKAECHFDSPQFLRYLEYCQAGEPDPEQDEIYTPKDWTEEEHEQNYIDQQNRYIEDHELLDNVYITSYQSYLYEIKGQFGGEDVTVLGEVDGKKDTAVLNFSRNCFAIPKCSENKELAWEFIKYRLSDSFYNKFCINGSFFRDGFPVTNSSFELCRQDAKKPQDNKYDVGYEDYTGYLYDTGYKDENGNYKYIELGDITDEVIATVDKYIAGAVATSEPNLFAGEDGEKYNEVYDICNEEMERLLHYEITPEECAYMLQNRVSIYLSEQFG